MPETIYRFVQVGNQRDPGNVDGPQNVIPLVMRIDRCRGSPNWSLSGGRSRCKRNHGAWLAANLEARQGSFDVAERKTSPTSIRSMLRTPKEL